MIIQTAGQKGGPGKSTLAANISVCLTCLDKDVVLIDADRQTTAANWASDRQEMGELPVVHCVQKYENIKDTVLDLDRRYEFVVIDSAGRDSREMRTGLLAADIVVVPFRCSQPDLDTMKKMEEIINEAKDFNKKLKPFALLNMAPTNPKINEIEEARDYLLDYPSIRLLETVIGDRKIYRDAFSEGKGVIEMNNLKASGEMYALMNELFKKTKTNISFSKKIILKKTKEAII